MITEEQINDLIESNEDYAKAYFIWQMDPNNTDIEQFYTEYLLPNLEETIVALMQHTGDSYEECEYAFDRRDWLVLTDEEADERCRQYAEDALEDVLYNVDKSLRYYFDEDRYIEDYLESGRGSILAWHDGREYEETVNGTTYYLYRT